MRALVLVTFADCENKVRSLEAAGHEVSTIQYDNRSPALQERLVEEANMRNPEFIVYIGAMAGSTHSIPNCDVLKRLNDIAPLIHLCSDAGDTPWWGLLEVYNNANCFAVQVAIDGSSSPINSFSNGLALLSPIDCRPYEPKAWEQRTSVMRMSGNAIGSGVRGQTLRDLVEHKNLEFRVGTHEIFSYDNYARFLCGAKVVVNHPMTGSGQCRHVKGRVVETGFAGACLLERRGSPTSKWFLPGVEYIEYEDDSPEAVMRAYVNVGDGAKKQIAERFHERVTRSHHPKVFWNAVLSKAGFE